MVIDTIRARRSVPRLVEPAPSAAELTAIVEAAACAPDHGRLRPWRFIVIEGDALDEMGAVLEEAYVARCAEQGVTPDEEARRKERTKLRRAPMVLVVAAVRRDDGRIPFVEQLLSAGAAAQNALLAATALGYGSMWRTGAPAYDDRVKAALGLGPGDAIVGFLYLGSVPEGVERRPHEPDLDDLVVRWRGEGRADPGAP